MFPEKFSVSGFNISPYDTPHDEEYINLMAEQWHIVLPENITFSDTNEKNKYTAQFGRFAAEILSSLERDIKSGKYLDYIISKNNSFCGVADVGFLYFEKPEVGIVLKKEYRFSGIGFTVMSEFIKRVKEETGFEKVIWRTEKTNIPAVRLALKLGGRERFVTDNYTGFEI